MPATEKFRKNVRLRLKDQSISIRGLAETAKLGSHTFLTNVLNGKHTVTIEYAERVALALGVTLLDLLADVPEQVA